MGKRDALYILSDMVEYDDCYVLMATKKAEIGKLKRGKGSQRKVSVVGAAEFLPFENPETGASGKFCGYFKMEVIGKVDRSHVNRFLKRNTEVDIALFTYRKPAYVDLEDIVDTDFTVVSGREATNDTLRCVHKAINNLKRKLLAINRMITYKYLENYLNEFVYKLNRRDLGERLFNRLVLASIYPYVQ
jgi:hypothetical protein